MCHEDTILCSYCKRWPRDYRGRKMTYEECYATKGICETCPNSIHMFADTLETVLRDYLHDKREITKTLEEWLKNH